MKLLFIVILLFGFICLVQNNIDISLYMKFDKIMYLIDIGLELGDLYKIIGYYGFVIENEWMVL